MGKRFSQFAEFWAGLIAGRPRSVLAVSLLAAAAGIVLAVTQMGFIADRNALISRNLDWNQRFLAWWERFPGVYDLLVVVDSHSHEDEAGLARAKAYLDDLGAALDREPTVERVEWRAAGDTFSPRTARLQSPAAFEDTIASARDALPLLKAATPGDLIAATVDALIQQGGGTGAAVTGGAGSSGGTGRDGAEEPNPDEAASQIGRLADLVEAFGRSIERDQPGQVMREALGGAEDEPWVYFVSSNNRLLFMRITPRLEAGAINALEESVLAVRSVMAEVGGRHPGIDAGLTGNEVVETDETIAITRDATLASILALMGVTVLLVSALGGFRIPLMAVSALLVGVAWSFGFLVLTVGHLQLLSVFFIAILLGLGIDFGIHLAAAMERCRPGQDAGPEGFRAGLAGAINLSAPGIMTGAITTAAAFGVMVFGDFSGVSEMGLIALGGILLCLVAMLGVFPAIWRLAGVDHPLRPIEQRRTIPDRLAMWAGSSSKRPGVVLVLAILVSIPAIWAALQIRFDYDLMAIQPQGIESIQWQQRISEDGGQSIWFAVSIDEDLETLKERAGRFRALEAVNEVLGIGMLFPADDPHHLRYLAEQTNDLREAVVAVSEESAPSGAAFQTAGQLDRRLQTLAQLIPAARESSDTPARGRRLAGLDGQSLDAEASFGGGASADDAQASDSSLGQDERQSGLMAPAGSEMPAVVAEQLSRLRAAIEKTRGLIAAQAEPQRSVRLGRLTQAYRQQRTVVAEQISKLVDGQPMTLEDFPESVLRPYIDRTDPDRPRYALEIHPGLPPGTEAISPLSPAFLPGLIADLRGVDPEVTGVIFQVYEFGDLMQRAYSQAGLLALGAVLVIIWISFRRLTDALMCLLPVAIGFLWTFGVMWAAGVTLNPANITVLPLMFGIGVDAAVHVLHRYRSHPLEAPPGLSMGTGKGITLTSLTTMIGFAAMMIADHRGIFSLGFVLTVGMGLTLVVCLTVMPAILELRNRSRERRRHAAAAGAA